MPRAYKSHRVYASDIHGGVKQFKYRDYSIFLVYQLTGKIFFRQENVCLVISYRWWKHVQQTIFASTGF